MKNMLIKQYFAIVFGMVVLLSLVPMHAMQQEEPTVKQQEVVSQSYWTRFKNFLHRTPLFPGWQSTEEQKKAAEEKLVNLLVEREQLEDERKSEQISDERLQEISKELKRINDEIKEQEVILGERWSSARRLTAAGGTALAAGLGMKYAMSLSLSEPTFNKLVKGKEFRWKVIIGYNMIGRPMGYYLKGYKAKYIKLYLRKNEEYHLQLKYNSEWKDAKYSVFFDLDEDDWMVEE